MAEPNSWVGNKIVEKGWRQTFTEDCNTTQVRAQKQRLSRCLIERELQSGHQKWTFLFIFEWPAFFKFFPFSFTVLVCVTEFKSLSSKLKQHLNIQKSSGEIYKKIKLKFIISNNVIIATKLIPMTKLRFNWFKWLFNF